MKIRHSRTLGGRNSSSKTKQSNPKIVRTREDRESGEKWSWNGRKNYLEDDLRFLSLSALKRWKIASVWDGANVSYIRAWRRWWYLRGLSNGCDLTSPRVVEKNTKIYTNNSLLVKKRKRKEMSPIKTYSYSFSNKNINNSKEFGVGLLVWHTFN